jgi:hypothetical protein
MSALLEIGPIPIGPIGDNVILIPAGQFGYPNQIGQVVLYNWSGFLVQIFDTQSGSRLDLQPMMGNVYDPPAAGAELRGRVASGVAVGGDVITGQVALMGEQIPGAWPITLVSASAGGGGGGGVVTIIAGPGISVVPPP